MVTAHPTVCSVHYTIKAQVPSLGLGVSVKDNLAVTQNSWDSIEARTSRLSDAAQSWSHCQRGEYDVHLRWGHAAVVAVMFDFEDAGLAPERTLAEVGQDGDLAQARQESR